MRRTVLWTVVLSFLCAAPLIWWHTLAVRRAPIDSDAIAALSAHVRVKLEIDLVLVGDAACQSLSGEYGGVFDVVSSCRPAGSLSPSFTSLLRGRQWTSALSALPEPTGPSSPLRWTFYSVPDASFSQLYFGDARNVLAVGSDLPSILRAQLDAEADRILKSAALSQDDRVADPALMRSAFRSVDSSNGYLFTWALIGGSPDGASSSASSALSSMVDDHFAPSLSAVDDLLGPFTLETFELLGAPLTVPATRLAACPSACGVNGSCFNIAASSLPNFVDQGEWRLADAGGLSPGAVPPAALNFVVYAPAAAQSPLVVAECAEGPPPASFFIPRWGGVAVLADDKKESMAAAMEKAKSDFEVHLRALLDIAPPAGLRTSTAVRARGGVSGIEADLAAIKRVARLEKHAINTVRYFI